MPLPWPGAAPSGPAPLPAVRRRNPLCDHGAIHIAGAPQHDVEVPEALRRLAGSRPLTVVWRNALGGLTFELGASPRAFVKWAPSGSELDLAAEAARMAWAAPHTPVPTVLDEGGDEVGTWLVTTALPGESAVSERWRADPARAVEAIGQGLRALHDSLPAGDCPFSWSVDDRLVEARRRTDAGLQRPAEWHPSHQHLSVAGALAIVADPPPVDRLVVCHGDACAPNTIVADDGRWSGHVDLGTLGVADRWADLAIATWSTGWNYGPGWEGRLLDAYGIDPDPARTRYHRLLWDLT